jgi:hypothetical protein
MEPLRLVPAPAPLALQPGRQAVTYKARHRRGAVTRSARSRCAGVTRLSRRGCFAVASPVQNPENIAHRHCELPARDPGGAL